ncbi:MAG: hypothetical protein ABW095_18790, partial [Candidatus Thiodiazotropha sp.]
NGVRLAGTVEKDEHGFVVAKDTPIQVDVAEITSDELDIVLPGILQATLVDPVLNGLHVTLSRGRLPVLTIDTGMLQGVSALVSRVIRINSEQPLEFRGFDTTAMIKLGLVPFTFQQLITGKVDMTLFGRKLVVKRLDGAISGFLSDQESGGIKVNPIEPLVLGALDLHLNPLSERFGSVDLGWDTLTLSQDADFDLTWSPVQEMSGRQGPPSGLEIRLKGLYANTATATGLWLSTDLLGAPVDLWMSAFGEALIFGLNLPAIDIQISTDRLAVEGVISGDRVQAQGLIAQLGERLRLEFDLASESLRFDALSDGPHRFGIDDIEVSGGMVALKGGHPIRWWDVRLSGDLSGSLGREGIKATLDEAKLGFEIPVHHQESTEAGITTGQDKDADFEQDLDLDKEVESTDRDSDANTHVEPPRLSRDETLDPDADESDAQDRDVDRDLPVEMEFEQTQETRTGSHEIGLGRVDVHATRQDVGFTVGPGVYTGDGIELSFMSLQARGRLGRPGDRPGKLGRVQLSNGGYSTEQGLPIMKLSDIDIQGAYFEIDDLSSWVGKPELAQLDGSMLRQLARGVSGSARFRAILKPGEDMSLSEVPDFDVIADIRSGVISGQVRGPRIGPFYVPKPILILPPIKVDPPDWVPYSGLLMFEDRADQGSLELFRAYARLPVTGWKLRILHVSVDWPPSDPVLVDLPSDYIDPVVSTLENVNLDLNVQLTEEVPLPGTNHLFFAPGSSMALMVTPNVTSPAHVLNADIALNARALRALLLNLVDLELSGITLSKGITTRIEYDGLAMKRVIGVVEHGHIDQAVLGIIPDKER